MPAVVIFAALHAAARHLPSSTARCRSLHRLAELAAGWGWGMGMGAVRRMLIYAYAYADEAFALCPVYLCMRVRLFLKV
eukprot:scaffold5520_cov102-Isochrysis_galbana.AAC.11